VTLLLLGLLLFFGTHALHIVAPGWRAAFIARHGELRWKGGYALLALLGLVLIVVGYGEARSAPQVLWVPPVWTRHLTALLLIPAMVLLVAADLPGSRIKQRVGHPMVAGVTLWALAHLLANGTVADLLLFGSFLGWSVASFVVSRGRDRRAGTTHPPGKLSRDVATLVVGLALWALFAFWLHGALFGVRPFG
jgi:uncharacterized membrane protein